MQVVVKALLPLRAKERAGGAQQRWLSLLQFYIVAQRGLHILSCGPLDTPTNLNCHPVERINKQHPSKGPFTKTTVPNSSTFGPFETAVLPRSLWQRRSVPCHAGCHALAAVPWLRCNGRVASAVASGWPLV